MGGEGQGERGRDLVSLPLLIRTPVLLVSLSPFNLNDHPKVPFPKYSHPEDEGFKIRICKRHNSVHNRSPLCVRKPELMYGTKNM